MIFVHQLFHGNFTIINSSVFFTPATASNTRGHNYKLFKSHTRCLARSEFFSNRVIENWNHLPYYILLNIYLMIIGQNIFMKYYNCTCCCMYACVGYTGCAFFP